MTSQPQRPPRQSAVVSDVYGGSYRTVRDKACVVSLGPSGGKVKVLRQTYGDSDSLSASPAYVNKIAYDRLAASTYLPTLPFNLALEECSTYLRQLGTPRIQLMEALLPKAAYTNAVESIGISTAEALLITTPDVAGLEKYWNSGNPADPAGKLKNIPAFITAAKIEYSELQNLINATGWLNPPEMLPPHRGVDRVDALFIKHKDSSCNLKEKYIKGWTWRPWIACTSSCLGGGKLNGDCLTAIRAASRLASDLSKGGTATTVADVVNIFAGLAVLSAWSPRPGPDAATYNSVFLNPSATVLVDADFEVRNIALNDSPTPPARIPKLLAKAEYIARCLSVSPEDARTLAGLVSPTEPNPDLTLNLLSAIFAVVSICRRLGLSVADYAIFAKLGGVDPLATTDNLSLFLTTVRKNQGLELAATDSLYLTRPPTTEALRHELPDATSPFDASLTAAQNQNAALGLLSQIRGITQPDLTQFQHMLAGDLNASDGESLITAKLHGLVPADAEDLIVQAQAELAASPGREDLKKELARVVCSTLAQNVASAQRQAALFKLWSTSS
ncbi:hypothetical protein QBC39DRAFT_399954 [Podospora conica]|nr:hypothetical protein QBC39DRAFT_399954 [Schizothecium conicum]